MTSIIGWFRNYLTNAPLIFVLSMFPLIELKGSIPVGLAMGMGLWEVFLWAYLGSCLPIPFIIIFIRDIFQFLKRYEKPRELIGKLEKKTLLKGAHAQRNGLIGLFIFVAIPLPGTGIWTGSLLAALLRFRLKYALPVIAAGNFVVGILILIVSYGAFHIFG